MIKAIQCQPEVRICGSSALHRAGLLSSKRQVPIEAGYATVIVDRHQAPYPAGEAPLEVGLSPDARVWMIPREFLLHTCRHGTRFRDDVQGEVDILWKLRVRAAGVDEQHPFCQWIATLPATQVSDPQAFLDRLTQELDLALGQLLGHAFATVEYRPGMAPHQCAEPLRGLARIPEIIDPLRNSIGCLLSEDPQVQRVASADTDADYARAQARLRARTKRREEVADHLDRLSADASVQAAEAKARQQSEALELERQKVLTDKETVLWRVRRQREIEEQRVALQIEQLRAEQSIQHDLQLAKVELARAEAQRKQAEANKELALAAQADAEKQLALRRVAELERERLTSDSVRLRLDSLSQALAALQGDLDRVQTAVTTGRSTPEPLALIARWRIHNRDGGVIDPCLGPATTWPGDTLLDVAVSVNRDAHVYVLLESGSQWTGLVPEWNDHGFGIDKNNRQPKNRVIIWPGRNQRNPALPFWMLDARPGVERFLVLASDEPLDDLPRLLAQEGLTELRRKAAPIAVRGVINPLHCLRTSPDGALGRRYHEVVTQLLGRGCVMQETVIHHV